MSSLVAGDGFSGRSGEFFPDPFLDYASLAMPRSIQQVLWYCERLFMANGTYRQAIDRVVSYFITELDIADVSDEEKEKWKQFFTATLDFRSVLHTIGVDAAAYGNSFTSVLPSFRRYLSCPACGLESPFSEVHATPAFQFQWSNFTFVATCPNCRKRGEWTRTDREDSDPDSIRVVRWNPHHIEILNDEYTGDSAYIWRIPEEYRRQIRQGKPFQLERARWEVIEAVRDNQHLIFDDGVVFHAKEAPMAGIRARGWGIGRAMINFRQAWYVQVLHRYNEAIAMDYVIPFRVITPEPTGPGVTGDPLINTNMAGFAGVVRAMLARRRRDPAAWNTLPFPIKYQALGGDARNLAPKELLDQGTESLLNAVGVPVEMYRGSLAVQAAPAALRLFEANWGSVPAMYNAFLRFAVKRVAQLLAWEPAEVRLTRVTHADDLQRQQTKLQLTASGQVSQTTGLASVGLDYRDEQRRILDEQRYATEEKAKLEQDMQQSAQMEQLGQDAPPQAAGQPAGQPGAAGQAYQSITANLPTGPNQAITPEELLQRAQYMATQLLGMPEAQKDSELIKLKRMDPTLHAQVRVRMQDMRQQAQTQGGAMLMAQQFGKAGKAGIRRVKRSVLDGVL